MIITIIIILIIIKVHHSQIWHWILFKTSWGLFFFFWPTSVIDPFADKFMRCELVFLDRYRWVDMFGTGLRHCILKVDAGSSCSLTSPLKVHHGRPILGALHWHKAESLKDLLFILFLSYNKRKAPPHSGIHATDVSGGYYVITITVIVVVIVIHKRSIPRW